MTNSLRLPAPAKLNLFLHITGRRPNGYHDLQTVFQFLDYGDTLSFRLEDRPGVRVRPDIPDVAPKNNLVLRAADALQSYIPTGAQRRLPGVSIHLEKRVPMGGGLGGGSSNAATTLLALNQLWELDLNLDALASIGLTLGADVPVFVKGHAAWAEGIGEQLTPVDAPEDWYLVLIPDCRISTAEIFQHERLTRDTTRSRIAPAFDGNSPEYRNDCEAVVCTLYPEVEVGMKWLRSQCGNARLTGTGSCIFSRFPTEFGALEVLLKKPSGVEGFVAKGLNRSPLHERLYELF